MSLILDTGSDKKTVLEMLKLALGMMIVGGGAAFSGGQYAAREVAAEVRLFAANAKAMEVRLQHAEVSSTRAEAMIELLLKDRGIKIPPKPDAGEEPKP